MKTALSFISILLLLVGCGNTVGPEDDFVRRVYEGPRWPVDFVVDDGIREASYVGINDVPRRDFPCVESASDARMVAVSAGFQISGDAPRETDFYFEFKSERQGSGQSLVRVLWRDYLESFSTSGASEWPAGDLEIGTVLRRPLTSQVVLRLFDHVWLLWNCLSSNVTLLERGVVELDSVFVLSVHEALVVGGDKGICDEIMQARSTYVIEKETGHVEFSREILPSMSGRCRYGS